MVRLVLAFLISTGFGSAALGQAMAVPVLDVHAVPYLDDAGRSAYQRWLDANLPRAFAVAPDGSFGAQTGTPYEPLETVRRAAIEKCAVKGAKGCALYAENLNVVRPSQEARTAPPPGPLISGWSYAFVPDENYIWRGPSQARGVLIWGHSYGGPEQDKRGIQPQAHNRPLNNAGYDVVRFDRQAMSDGRDAAAGWLRDGLRQLRRLGYRSVVVGGESRGAWNSLQVLDTPGLADAVIAVSAAAHGYGGSTNLMAQTDELRSILSGVAPGRTRVAFIQFANDLYISDPDRRAALMQNVAPRLEALLLIDRPDGLSGHDASGTDAFAERYGDCLKHFIMDVQPPRSCSGKPR